jgi:putative phosphonate metabolism protein
VSSPGVNEGYRLDMRYAIYYTPPADAPLTRAASSWLGRDAFTGALTPPSGGSLSSTEIATHTAPPRHYGFHATLKAPFRLADNETEASLVKAVDAFAAGAAPVVLPRIRIGQLDGFFALLPERRSAELDRFAGDAVTAFDRFRAPANEADILRRNPEALDHAQLKNLQRWGYPYVFESFRFHMTLTGRVQPQESPRVRQALEDHFASAVPEPFEIASLALFVESEPGAPFKVYSFHPLGRRSKERLHE